MPRKAESKRGKQGGKAKAAGKSKPAAKPASKGDTPKLITDAESKQVLTVEQLIAFIAEADAQRVRREALDAKTGGQYGALCELADAFAAVLETKESQEVFTWDEYPDPASAAKDFVSELEGRPQRVVKAREALLRTGYAVPDEWLVVDVDFPIHRPKPPPQFATTPPRSGAWRVWWCGAKDPAALDRCLRQVRVAILRFENAPAAIAQTETPPVASAMPRLEDGEADGAVTQAKAKTNRPDLGGDTHGPDFRSVRWGGDTYTFSPNQAACVRQWWEAMENGTPDVGGDTVLATSDINSQRLQDVFRNHPAWGVLIVSGATKGAYRIAPKKT